MHRSVSVGFVALLVVALVGAVAMSPLLVSSESTQDSPGSTSVLLTDRDATLLGTGTPDGAENLGEIVRQDGNIDSPAVDRVVTEDDVPPEFDITTFEITVYENGSASWTFKYEVYLSTDDERDQFEAFAERFETEELDFYDRFTDQAHVLADRGAQATDRDMEATRFNRSASIEQRLNEWGVVEMSFVWTDFAAVTDDTIVVGDVFEGDGFYIQPGQSLVITTDEGLVFQDATPSPPGHEGPVSDMDSITWEGEFDFDGGEPRVTIVSADATEDESDGGVFPAGNDTVWQLGLFAILVLAMGAGLAWYRFSDDGFPAVWGRQSAKTDSGTDEESSTATHPESISEEAFVTDEERVISLIQDNGGRMKQVDIVEETDWSKSKVSMLLSEMEDAEQINKLRVGRENIISLEGYEPEATKSPFEDA